MGGLIELLIVIIIGAVIYQMFFTHKDLPKYDPRNNKAPDYDKSNYITPPKEKDSYTPEAPTGSAAPYAEAVVTDPRDPNYQKDIKLDMDRTLLGQSVDSYENFYLTDKELNGMCLLVGATGAGKTTAIKTLLERPLKQQYPIIIVDGKGDPSFPDEIAELCTKYKRNFKIFNSHDASKSMHYNPLRHGQYTELKDKLIDIFEWSEDYYKNQAERFLQGVFKLLLMPETQELLDVKVIDLPLVCELMNVDTITNIIPQLDNKANFMLPILDEADPKAIDGFCARLKTITESELGELFKDTQDPNVIDLFESIYNYDVVFFSIDSLKYAVYAQMLGRLIIADLKTVSPRFSDKKRKIYTVFDEFNVFASPVIVNLINKTRGYNFHNILGTQELADMVINGDRKLLDQIIGNTNVKICLRQDVPSSQEELSKTVGSRDIYKPTFTKGKSGQGKEGESNSMSVTLDEEFYYKSREFGQLGIGQAIVFVKVTKFRHAKINVRRVS